jgi:hypothetical protein
MNVPHHHPLPTPKTKNTNYFQWNSRISKESNIQYHSCTTKEEIIKWREIWNKDMWKFSNSN